MSMIKSKSNEFFLTRQALVKDEYLYNIDPTDELELLTRYINHFEGKSRKETTTILSHYKESFVKETKVAQEEVQHFSHILMMAEKAIKITDDSIRSNIKEYEQNVKARAQIVEVIYQILELMNKRSKKIKGFQLKYIDAARTKFFDYGNSYEFKAFTRYVFIDDAPKFSMKKTLKELPPLVGIKDKNAQAPALKKHIPLNPVKKSVKSAGKK